MAVSCKIHPSRSDYCIIKYSNHYRKRYEMKIEILNPIRAHIWRVYFPGVKLQECRGLTDFENYCTLQVNGSKVARHEGSNPK
jgi:hypothetical protein